MEHVGTCEENHEQLQEEDRRRRAGGEGGSGRTAFRDAEYLYKLRFDEVRRRRAGARGKGERVRLVQRPLRLNESMVSEGRVLRASAGVVREGSRDADDELGMDGNSEAALPQGAHILRGFLTFDEQVALVKLCLDAPDPLTPSNHTAHMGSLPAGLFAAATRGDVLNENGAGWSRAVDDRGDGAASNGRRGARDLMNRLRWIALGPPYNWTTRVYEPMSVGRAHRGLPQLLRDIGLRAVDSCCSESAFASFDPNAALVNYYGPKDTLMGHVDDAEPDLSKPIVALCLGVPAVFLIGTETREEEPAAFLVRSGDVVVLSGRARRCYHGIPRIIASPNDLQESLRGPGRGLDTMNKIMAPFSGGEWPDDFASHATYMSGHRISISIRDVGGQSSPVM